MRGSQPPPGGFPHRAAGFQGPGAHTRPQANALPYQLPPMFNGPPLLPRHMMPMQPAPAAAARPTRPPTRSAPASASSSSLPATRRPPASSPKNNGGSKSSFSSFPSFPASGGGGNASAASQSSAAGGKDTAEYATTMSGPVAFGFGAKKSSRPSTRFSIGSQGMKKKVAAHTAFIGGARPNARRPTAAASPTTRAPSAAAASPTTRSAPAAAVVAASAPSVSSAVMAVTRSDNVSAKPSPAVAALNAVLPKVVPKDTASLRMARAHARTPPRSRSRSRERRAADKSRSKFDDELPQRKEKEPYYNTRRPSPVRRRRSRSPSQPRGRVRPDKRPMRSSSRSPGRGRDRGRPRDHSIDRNRDVDEAERERIRRGAMERARARERQSANAGVSSGARGSSSRDRSSSVAGAPVTRKRKSRWSSPGRDDASSPYASARDKDDMDVSPVRKRKSRFGESPVRETMKISIVNSAAKSRSRSPMAKKKMTKKRATAWSESRSRSRSQSSSDENDRSNKKSIKRRKKKKKDKKKKKKRKSVGLPIGPSYEDDDEMDTTALGSTKGSDIGAERLELNSDADLEDEDPTELDVPLGAELPPTATAHEPTFGPAPPPPTRRQQYAMYEAAQEANGAADKGAGGGNHAAAPAPLLPSQQASFVHRVPGALQHHNGVGNGGANASGVGVAHLTPLEQLRVKIPRKNTTGCRLLFANLPLLCDRTALTKLIHRTLKESHVMLFKGGGGDDKGGTGAALLAAFVEECYVNTNARFAFVTLGSRDAARAVKDKLDGYQFSVATHSSILTVTVAAHKAAVWVGDLHPLVSNERLYRSFERFGPVERAVVVTNAADGKSAGHGIVEFTRKAHQLAAIQHCNEGLFMVSRTGPPARVKPFEHTDDDEGLEHVRLEETNELKEELSLAPDFARRGTVAFTYAMKWRQLAIREEQEKTALREKFEREREDLLREQQVALRADEIEDDEARTHYRASTEAIDRQRREQEAALQRAKEEAEALQRAYVAPVSQVQQTPTPQPQPQQPQPHPAYELEKPGVSHAQVHASYYVDRHATAAATTAASTAAATAAASTAAAMQQPPPLAASLSAALTKLTASFPRAAAREQMAASPDTEALPKTPPAEPEPMPMVTPTPMQMPMPVKQEAEVQVANPPQTQASAGAQTGAAAAVSEQPASLLGPPPVQRSSLLGPAPTPMLPLSGPSTINPYLTQSVSMSSTTQPPPVSASTSSAAHQSAPSTPVQTPPKPQAAPSAPNTQAQAQAVEPVAPKPAAMQYVRIPAGDPHGAPDRDTYMTLETYQKLQAKTQAAAPVASTPPQKPLPAPALGPSLPKTRLPPPQHANVPAALRASAQGPGAAPQAAATRHAQAAPQGVAHHQRAPPHVARPAVGGPAPGGAYAQPRGPPPPFPGGPPPPQHQQRPPGAMSAQPPQGGVPPGGMRPTGGPPGSAPMMPQQTQSHPQQAQAHPQQARVHPQQQAQAHVQQSHAMQMHPGMHAPGAQPGGMQMQQQGYADVRDVRGYTPSGPQMQAQQQGQPQQAQRMGLPPDELARRFPLSHARQTGGPLPPPAPIEKKKRKRGGKRVREREARRNGDPAAQLTAAIQSGRPPVHGVATNPALRQQARLPPGRDGSNRATPGGVQYPTRR